MCEIFKHIKYRRTLRRWQTLLVKIELAAEHQHAVTLNDVGGLDPGSRLFMFANEFVGFFQKRLAIDGLGCTLHKCLLCFFAASLRRAAARGKFSIDLAGVIAEA